MIEQLIDEALAMVTDLDERAAPLEVKLAEIRQAARDLVAEVRDSIDEFAGVVAREDKDAGGA